MMGRLVRSVALASSLAVVLVMGSLSLGAQESASPKPAEKSSAPAGKQTSALKGQVPRFFGQVGLTDDQRQSIYQIQAKHKSKIDELEKELAALQAQVLSECEAVLSDAQKQVLEQHRNAAEAAKKARRSAKAKTTTKSSEK